MKATIKRRRRFTRHTPAREIWITDRVLSVLRALARFRFLTIDQIITSPLLRTRQTADVIAESLKGKPAVVTSDALSPAGTPGAVMQDLAKHAKKGSVALVGHEPNLGELAARLIGARTALEFKKGGVCRIDFETLPPKSNGRLRWFVTPRMLRKLA